MKSICDENPRDSLADLINLIRVNSVTFIKNDEWCKCDFLLLANNIFGWLITSRIPLTQSCTVGVSGKHCGQTGQERRTVITSMRDVKASHVDHYIIIIIFLISCGVRYLSKVLLTWKIQWKCLRVVVWLQMKNILNQDTQVVIGYKSSVKISLVMFYFTWSNCILCRLWGKLK